MMSDKQILDAITKSENGVLENGFWESKSHEDRMRAYALIENRFADKPPTFINIGRVFHKGKLIKVIIGDYLFRKQK